MSRPIRGGSEKYTQLLFTHIYFGNFAFTSPIKTNYLVSDGYNRSYFMIAR